MTGDRESDVAAYLATQCARLAAGLTDRRTALLRYLLEVAAAEAKRVARGRGGPPEPPGGPR